MKSERILIFRPDNIGDVVLFSGAFKHIRSRFPDAEITLAVQKHIINLVELCPSIDNCISLEDLNWRRSYKDPSALPFPRLEAMVRKIERSWKKLVKPFDIVIYPVRSPQKHHLQMLSYLCVKRIKGIVGCTVNLSREAGSEHLDLRLLFSDVLDVSKEDPWRHEFFTTLDFLKFLGCDVSAGEDIRPEIWVSSTDRNLLEHERRGKRYIIGLFPGGSFKGKCWNADNYETIARILPDQVLYVIFGGSEDVGISRDVESFLKIGCRDIAVINLAGRTTLRELYKTISACDLVISMDSSGLHLATTAGIPTVGIVGGWHYGRFSPWGEPDRHIAMTNRLECFHCNWNCTKERIECIQGVAAADVARCADMLLKRIGSAHTSSTE